jgi:hypothetical protein
MSKRILTVDDSKTMRDMVFDIVNAARSGSSRQRQPLARPSAETGRARLRGDEVRDLVHDRKMMPTHPATEMDGSSNGRRPPASLWDGVSEQSLARALEPPVVYCVERGLPEVMQEPGGPFHSLGLAITTRAAFRLPVANAFIDAVDQRLHLDNDLRVHMLTVLTRRL